MLSVLVLITALAGVTNPSSCQDPGKLTSPDKVAKQISREIGIGTDLSHVEEILRHHCLEFSYVARDSFVNFGFKPKSAAMAGVIYAKTKAAPSGDVFKSYQILIALDAKGVVMEIKEIPVYTGL